MGRKRVPALAPEELEKHAAAQRKADEAVIAAEKVRRDAEKVRKAEAERERKEHRLTATIIVRAYAKHARWLEGRRREAEAKLPGHHVTLSDVVRGIIDQAMKNVEDQHV